jgi:hypothetical protein
LHIDSHQSTSRKPLSVKLLNVLQSSSFIENLETTDVEPLKSPARHELHHGATK